MDGDFFDQDEMLLMKDAIKNGHKFWDDKSIFDIKRKIKNSLRVKQAECCCYCSRNTDGEFNMVLDIEHVIPKSKIVSEMFEMRNLAVSCKRCNMRIKGEDISFINDDFDVFKNNKDYYHSECYSFIHPNLDDWDDNLLYVVQQVNKKKIIYYQVVRDSLKGEYTKNYFKLDEIQVNTFDEAQGATIRKEPKSFEVAEDYSKLVAQMLGSN
ncbi:TIGR02646 family protein [Hafnia alvei]|uniref:TIGR02646 family protein n=2 Tax=Hafnia alvei TaxID=569 RepID=A0A1C6Z3U2_HAFAL|nr:TIGR02646 family protein [Hafnia alvei]